MGEMRKTAKTGNGNLGRQLRLFLADNDITQAEAASRINRTTRTLSRILNGEPVSDRTRRQVEKMISGVWIAQ